MSTHVLSYEVEGIEVAKALDLAKMTLVTQLATFGRAESIIFVPDEVAQTMRLHDSIVVTIEVPEDADPEPDEPEDAPAPEYTMTDGRPLKFPRVRLGDAGGLRDIA